MKDDFSIIILAAGASTRLGQPKQLLEFKGKTLIVHSIEQALDSKGASVFVVLGANTDQIESSIHSLPIELIHNSNWQEGIGSSIALAIKTVEQKQPNSKAVLLMLCDQPFVNGELLKKLSNKFLETESPVVACSYQNTFGIPAIFAQSLYEELKELDGDRGAKKLITKYQKQAVFIPFAKGGFDVDTLEDYEELKFKRFT